MTFFKKKKITCYNFGNFTFGEFYNFLHLYDSVKCFISFLQVVKTVPELFRDRCCLRFIDLQQEQAHHQQKSEEKKTRKDE